MKYRLAIILASCLLPFTCGVTLYLVDPDPAGSAHLPQIQSEDSILSVVHLQPWDFPDSISATGEAFHGGLDRMFRRYQQSRDFNGVVLVANQGRIVHTGSYGYANTRTRDTLDLHSVFQLASITKMFTAVAILKLYEAGLLDFDDKVSQHIPTWPYKGMTIRHLLNHRSGLQRYDDLSLRYWDRRKFMHYADVLDLYIDQRPWLFFEPGIKFDYSNSNYAILAALVDYIARKPFEQFVEEKILQPLGMNDTYYCNYLERVKKPKHTIGYVFKGKRYRPALGDHLDGVMGDKGLHSTVKDLFKFDQALYRESFLKAATRDQAYSPDPHSADKPYGFGFRLKENYPGLVYHFGWWRGYRTFFIRDIQAEITLIVLTNRDRPGKYLNIWQVYRYLSKHSPAV